MGEKECYLCKQMGHYKKDCTDKENASKTFANRVNRVDEMPDAQGVEEGEDEETMGGEDQNKSQNEENLPEKKKQSVAESISQDVNNEENMNSSNIDGQNTDENLTITSLVNEVREKYGNANGANTTNIPSEEKAKETVKRTREERNLDSSASSTASPNLKLIKNSDEKQENLNEKNECSNKKSDEDSDEL
jgi:hypothetical protein